MKNFKFTIQNYKKGFTLIEFLIVIAIIGVVASVIFVAVDPITRFRDARNAQRWRDVEAVGDAIRIYQVDNQGQVPVGVDGNWRMLGTDANGCDIACGATGEISGSYLHNNQDDFNAGIYSNTQWNNGNEWIELVAGSSGTYTSPVIDAGVSNTWATLAWQPERPTYKALPNNKASESAYSSGNANMSNNVLLYHLDESAGTIVDSSGNGNSGTYNGSLYSQSGKLGTSLGFDGINDFIEVEGNLDPDLGDSSVSVAFWIRVSNTKSTVVLGNSISYYGPGFMYRISNGWGGTSIFWFKDGGPKSGSQYSYAGKDVVDGQWHYVVGVLNRQEEKIRVYVDGLDYSSPLRPVPGLGSIASDTKLVIGHSVFVGPYFEGELDEFQIHNRVLSPTEILDQYKRGALRLNLQVRSCDDAVCAGESFVGPDGTAGTYYNELNNTTTGLPSFNLANVVDNQYFQYQTSFATDNTLYSPELSSVTIGTMATGEGGDTLQSACLDLTAELANKLPKVPQDPSIGTLEKTYYALQRDNVGQINVQACGAEGETIKISR